MNKSKFLLTAIIIITIMIGCKKEEQKKEEFMYVVDKFADLRLLQYDVPGFENLSLQQKKYVYYLSQAANTGRDILYDQNYKHNLYVRKTLENIALTYNGDKNTNEFNHFMTYLKRVWFSNGIHHHYGNQKFLPEFSFEYFTILVDNSNLNNFPLQEGETIQELKSKLEKIMFDQKYDEWRITPDTQADVVAASSNNYYENLTKDEVESFYKKISNANDPRPISYGLNSKLVKENGHILEKVWKIGGMYSGAIEKIVFWLEKALEVAENDIQKKWLSLLIDYYKTGDLKLFDEYNVVWVKDIDSMVDLVNGFIESYGDPLGYKASYESIVSIRDIEATKRVDAISKEAQWFEDNAPFMPQHKKEKVTGVTGKVINIVANAGDCHPATPLGINLPNADWIRKEHGSKSVTLGNIKNAYSKADASTGLLEEFYFSQESIDRAKKYGDLADNLHTDLHEVIGHGSGQLEPGVATPNETLKQYSSVMEEVRADLVALYYIIDNKMVNLGIIPSIEVGKATYDNFITNGLIRQIVRIKLGDNIQQTHMRGRQLTAKWVYEKGQADNVVEMVKRDNKTFYIVNDYNKLRNLFGELLKEVQRIKSQGDFKAAQNLVENYGVKIDYDLHKEVLDRFAKLNLAPYTGFLTPRLVPIMKGNEIIDVKLEYDNDWVKQSLWLSKEYSFLPAYN